MFLHPVNLRLYEVVHIYWDRRSKQIAVLRRATDPMVLDPDNRLAYPLKGDRGILRLIERYEQQAGYTEAAAWPTPEATMYQLQQQCPSLENYLTAVMASPTKSITVSKKIFYVPQQTEEDNTIQYGAMRVRPKDDVMAAAMDRHPVALPVVLQEQAIRSIHDAFGHPG